MEESHLLNDTKRTIFTNIYSLPLLYKNINLSYTV